MSLDALAVVRFAHLISALFMAAPLYALLAVNERARFPVPQGYNTDRFLENIVRSQPVRCYAYLGMTLVTGFLLLQPWQAGFADRLVDWPTVVKLEVLAILVFLLSHVRLTIQPRIETLLADSAPNSTVPEDRRPALMALRTRRKRLSSMCLFLVLTAFAMGERASLGYSVWLVVLILIVAGIFAWRVYRRPLPYGWF
jgi:hypothetical protein